MIAPDQIDVEALALALAEHMPAQRPMPETFTLARDQRQVELARVPTAEPVVARNGVLLDWVEGTAPTRGKFGWAGGKVVMLSPEVRPGDSVKVIYW